MKKKENRILQWIKENRKVLYWPLGGLVYFIVLGIFYYAPSLRHIWWVLGSPLGFFNQLWYSVNKLYGYSFGLFGFFIWEFILAETFLSFYGFIYKKSKRKLLSIIIFILILLLFSLLRPKTGSVAGI